MEDSEQKLPKRTLAQKYEIPIEFLDFSYVKTCSDVKTLEKIVKILRSGEEGYYPDLTKSAEEKLKSLKPDSKMFRVEEPMVKKEFLDEEKRLQIDEDMKMWINDMKQQDLIVKEIKPNSAKPEPPIRKAGKTIQQPSEILENPQNAAERIKSTDYAKWDKFDAEAAELKIDLDEERKREIVEVKNKKNIEKTKLIEVIGDAEVDCLSDFEKDQQSLKFKEKGNECYKAKEYDEAIKEYTQSLRIKKSAAAFNNRALVYLKLKSYIKTISDANQCLKLEPENIKALIRKAQAFVGEKMFAEAFDTFEKVLDIDASNQIAHQEMAELRKKIPPKNSFRMKIEEIEDDEKPTKCVTYKSEKLEIPEASHVPKMVQNIIIEEASPFDKLKPKVEEKKPRDMLIMPSDVQSKKKMTLIEEIL